MRMGKDATAVVNREQEKQGIYTDLHDICFGFTCDSVEGTSGIMFEIIYAGGLILLGFIIGWLSYGAIDTVKYLSK